MPTPAPAPVVDTTPTEEDNAEPKPKKGGLLDGLKKLGKRATELLEKMDSGNNDDDII